MAIKKAKKYNLKKYAIIGGVVLIAIGAGSGAYIYNQNNTPEEKDSISTSTTLSSDSVSSDSLDNDGGSVEKSYTFTEMKSSYEYPDNAELNGIIDKIKGVSFESTDGYFYNYEIEDMISEELEYIKSNSGTYKFKMDNTSYDWYKNKEVDCNILYDKIIQNSKDKNIDINDGQEIVTRKFAENLQDCMNYIRQKNPNYDFTIPLYNINNLTVTNITDTDYASFYDYTKNNFEIDYDNVGNAADYNIVFQLFQVLENQSVANSDIYITSFNMDASNTSATPIFWDFIIQSFSEKYTGDYFGGEAANYMDETNKIELIAEATGSSYETINRLFLTSDQEGLIKLFEKEMQDSTMVFTILELLDISCGYGSVPDGCDEVSFRSNAGAKARLLLLENYYIKMAKQIIVDNQSFDNLEDKMLEKKQTILNGRYDNYYMNSETEEQLYNAINGLDEIIFNMKYSK